jgi:hypothetical protein
VRVVGWTRSSHHSEGRCAEVGTDRYGVVYIRSSDPASAAVALTPTAWAEFIAGIKAGEFDDLLKSS